MNGKLSVVLQFLFLLNQCPSLPQAQSHLFWQARPPSSWMLGAYYSEGDHSLKESTRISGAPLSIRYRGWPWKIKLSTMWVGPGWPWYLV